jgi:cob(I)alamin adenosyltransferase
MRVYIIQFIKGGFDYGELHSVKHLPNLKLTAFGRGRFITEAMPPKEDLQKAQEGFELAKKVVNSGEYDIVVLDEINVVMHLKMISVDQVVKLVKNKPKHVELILTGRNAPVQIIEIADLVTEMKEIKHPYAQGTPPRKGIEY